jgi:hypothetical protein
MSKTEKLFYQHAKMYLVEIFLKNVKKKGSLSTAPEVINF